MDEIGGSGRMAGGGRTLLAAPKAESGMMLT